MDSVLQFSKSAEQLLVLSIKLGDVDAVTWVPMKRAFHESPIVCKLVV